MCDINILKINKNQPAFLAAALASTFLHVTSITQKLLCCTRMSGLAVVALEYAHGYEVVSR